MKESEVLLEVKNLKTHFNTINGVVPSVEDVSFYINKGEKVAIVGESGSGKSVTSLSIMRLLSETGKIIDGSIHFCGRNLIELSEKDMRKIRGNEIAMVFQEPLSSLNPVMTVGKQIMESILLHQKTRKQNAKQQVIDLLNKVGIPRPEKVFSSYPHLLSGGMRQRVMIAMALSCQPKLIIADEPTTALDVTIQAQILSILKELSEQEEVAILLITHDLGVVAEVADRVIVMYAGQVVEQAEIFSIFDYPKHPYTKALLNSTPKLDFSQTELLSIEGTVPSPMEIPTGCRFYDRCDFSSEICKQSPELKEITDGHQVRCWLVEEAIDNRI
ncbi:oligopeptide/dipeptide ABC transporter ATP-binding protein [Evansella vedderi]|uniref:Oligopeptide/dipeptide ABC transporter ATP-binding protein n=1 Tax=Evansella vedderi TaxID=38282 RepID=A0ABT9ZYV0_9BACI|nr:ABC transporter ATP-binding protein [Evansella vedderi]MDQ0256431.1 oligopeptide/dipeptide ABC transporter ATP-binding protein [Evansella vedderi]